MAALLKPENRPGSATIWLANRKSNPPPIMPMSSLRSAGCLFPVLQPRSRTVDLFNFLLLAFGIAGSTRGRVGSAQIPPDPHHLRSMFLRGLQLSHSVLQASLCD